MTHTHTNLLHTLTMKVSIGVMQEVEDFLKLERPKHINNQYAGGKVEAEDKCPVCSMTERRL